MFEIQFNNKTIKYSKPVVAIDLIQKVGSDLKQKCIAVKVNGSLKDLTTIINDNCEVDLVFSDSLEGLEIIRHDAAHILAQAVKELFPEAISAIGPVTNDGFYYDFGNIRPLNDLDLDNISSKMQEIINQSIPITKGVVQRNDAIKFFQQRGEKYKVQIIQELPLDTEITIYTQGNFVDLCKGPHSMTTRSVSAFKLMKVSGSYWHGNSKNDTLQRVYGTAWSSQSQLIEYLDMLKEAEKRDHRKIGKACNLFHFQSEAQGAVFWHPNGWNLFQTLIQYIRQKHYDNNYLEVNTPEIIDKKLWVSSGHWEKFRESMFTAKTINSNKLYAVRPMNCPGGVQIYKQSLKSYRDLPLRLAEFGKVHRFEPSGSLYGLMRLRSFTQDDAHVFCTNKQITQECVDICILIKEIYKDFGFKSVKIKFSDRPDERIGSKEIWDKSEKALLDAIKQQDIPFTLNKGEGAFYGPKLEFILKDAIGREWQLGTLQVDFNLPERLDIHYINEDGNKVRPVMLHRALFGSVERFLGILLEHYSGRLPIWLAPVQVVIATVTEEAIPYAKSIAKILKDRSIRYLVDLENEKISNKIRKHSIGKVPVILVLGKKEAESNIVSVRKLGNKDQEVLELNNFVDRLLDEIKQKRS